MTLQNTHIRQARASDARVLAHLIDTAGEGIPNWLWTQWAEPGQTAMDVGEARARRDTGGFSYMNAVVIAANETVLGMALSYPISEAPTDDPDDLPAPIAPFLALEALSVGTWYINALAISPGHRGKGFGAHLLAHCKEMALSEGYDRMSIQVYAQNVGAVRLYRRLGYRETGRSPVREHPCQPYYTGDVLLLEKTLN